MKEFKRENKRSLFYKISFQIEIISFVDSISKVKVIVGEIIMNIKQAYCCCMILDSTSDLKHSEIQICCRSCTINYEGLNSKLICSNGTNKRKVQWFLILNKNHVILFFSLFSCYYIIQSKWLIFDII